MFGKYYKYIMKPRNKQAKPPDHQHWLPAAIQTCVTVVLCINIDRCLQLQPPFNLNTVFKAGNLNFIVN